MAKKVLRSAEKFSEPFPPLSVTPLPLSNYVLKVKKQQSLNSDLNSFWPCDSNCVV